MKLRRVFAAGEGDPQELWAEVKSVKAAAVMSG